MSEGTLLGGRIRYAQLADGYRTGLEPVLLAATIPARAGDRVLEAGTGAGAGLLCVAARIPGIIGVGVERDAVLAALAATNMAANGFERLSVAASDLAEWSATAPFDHAFANPPWHLADATASPDARRDAAKRAADGLLALWVARLAKSLRPRGTLSLVLPTGRLPEALAAYAAAGCGSASVLPLWPKRDREAKLLLLRGIRGGRASCRVLPGLVLHTPDNRLTDETEAILRQGAALAF